MMQNRSGAVVDIFVIAAAVFMIAVTFLVLFYVQSDELVPEMKNSEMGTVAGFNATITKGTTDVAVAYDGIVLAIYCGLIVAFILSAFVIRTSPAFVMLWIIMLIIAIIVAVPLANSYTLIQAELGHAADFTMTSFIMDHLPLLVACAGVFGIVAMYAKSRYFTEA